MTDEKGISRGEGEEELRGRPAVSPETVASIDKMTSITVTCTKQLEGINQAMERVLEKQHIVEDLEHILKEASKR